MSCGIIEFVRGGLLQEVRIVDSKISGSDIESSSLKDSSLSGSLTLEPSTLAQLASDIESLLNVPLDRAAAAAVFKDSTNENPLVPDTVIVTKADLTAINDALMADITAAMDPALVIGKLKDSTNELPLVPDTVIVTKADLAISVADIETKLAAATDPTSIAGVFKNDDGNPLAPGSKLLTKAQIKDLVKIAICEGCGNDAGIQSVVWDSTAKKLTITELVNNSNVVLEVTLTGLASELTSSAMSPTSSIDSVLPLDVVGSRTKILGTPSAWLRCVVGGVEGVIPWYAV